MKLAVVLGTCICTYIYLSRFSSGFKYQSRQSDSAYHTSHSFLSNACSFSFAIITHVYDNFFYFLVISNHFIWQLALRLHTCVLLSIVKVVARGMVARGAAGSIVNISSIASVRVVPNHTCYCTAKAALDMLTMTLAYELGPKKVRPLARLSVCPCVPPSVYHFSSIFKKLNLKNYWPYLSIRWSIPFIFP